MFIVIAASVAADSVHPIGIVPTGTGHIAGIINHDVGYIGLTRIVLKDRKETAGSQADIDGGVEGDGKSGSNTPFLLPPPHG